MAVFDQLRDLLETTPNYESVTPVDIGELPEPLRASLKRAMRTGGTSLAEMADELELDQSQTEMLALLLVAKGFLRSVGSGPGEVDKYRINLARRKGRGVPLDL